nr:hypothetical protein [Lachnospiraceae bacterium]
METKNIPAIVMLLAGLVTSIVMYRNDYDLNTTLKVVLLVFFVFYIFGSWIKRLLDKFCPVKTEEEEKEGEEDGDEEKAEGEESQNQDGSVIEKK